MDSALRTEFLWALEQDFCEAEDSWGIPPEDLLLAVAYVQLGSPFAMSFDLALVIDAPEAFIKAACEPLVEAGMLLGCPCGCRGDYELTDDGERFLAEYGDLAAVEFALNPSDGVIRGGRLHHSGLVIERYEGDDG